ncbi:superoxide dismutase [Mn]-like [Argiope bruennichi]|uniref:superoxide dismutase [Mn]-like n=1 Tax=Argiope bruennichi TaxID=94029 RepID=UPI0024955FF1|nr:superoxide dismutase [Mn]-like [Argiope bruennichi]
MMISFINLIILQLFVTFGKGSEIAPAFYGLERPALEYELPPLLYTFDELEPYMDEGTAKMHYFEYHGFYIQEVNSILKRWRRNNVKGKHASRMSIIDILRNLSHIPFSYRTDLKNYGSGLLNHNLYWATISPNPQGEHRLPVGHLADKINTKFGSFLEFKATFTDVASNHFGSGFVWLCRNHSSQGFDDLVIMATDNENSPLSYNLLPILGIDIWEHAYIMKLHNQKSKYIENWWYLVDWQQVNNLAEWWTGLKLHDEL